MLLLLLVIGGVAAMTMSSKGENNYSIEPKINLGSIPEFDKAQNEEDIENKMDKTVEDVVMVEIKKEENLKKFTFGDVNREVEVALKWLLYEASTMWSMYDYLDWYMKKNEFRGIDDLRSYGPMGEGVLELFSSLVSICKKRAMEFRQLWIRLSETGNFGWMAANQWLLNTPTDIMNLLRQFDASELAYNAAMEIADGRSMDDINRKLMWLYKAINKQPSEELGTISATLQDVINNQNIMMQVDEENAGKFALLGTNGYANLKRTTHQARAPSEDPFSGAPGSYSKTATYVGQDGVPRTMNVTYDADTQMTDFTAGYGQPGGRLPTQAPSEGFASDAHRMGPTESITIPPLRPDPTFDQANATGKFGSAYAAIDPRSMPIDAETKSDLFKVRKGGNLFANAKADLPDQNETYQNPPSYGPMDDDDSNAPPRATNVPATMAQGYVKATANTIKPGTYVDQDAYTKEVTGSKRTAELEFNFTNDKRFKEDTKKPSATSQQLEAADADPYVAAGGGVSQYDIMRNNQPRDELAQEGNVESWPAKNTALRTISEIPAKPQTQMDGDDQFAAVPAAATNLGIGMKLTEVSVPPSALVNDPYVGLKDPTKQTHLVSKGAATGGTYRGRSGSFDMYSAAMGTLATQPPPKMPKARSVAPEDQTVQMMDAVDVEAAEL